MKKFTEAYTKARDIFTTQKFAEPEWHKFLLQDAKVKQLLGHDGPDVAQAGAPDKVRKKIKDEANNAFVAFFVGGGPDEVIYEAAKNTKSSGSINDRAAALKFVRHLYRANKRGAQDVWIYSPPAAYSSWVFDELKGTEKTVKTKLGMENEIFSGSDQKNICTALALALKISETAKTKLAAPDEDTKKVVKRWFMDENCGDDEMSEALTKLHEGFKKIANSCNSNKLVLTDYPDWRAQRDEYMGAAFRGGEGGGFPVVYIEGAFTEKAENSGQHWTCARTIIHEFSHHDLSTRDHKYRHQGLKPNKDSFPYAKTITNADSWGVFAVDLAGYLSVKDRTDFWK